VNALAKLRERLGVGPDALARALGIPVADVETLEGTPLRLLEIGDVAAYVGALGCRLDVVAQHVDGVAHWLNDGGAQ
jgi:hypothetical protein